MFPLILATILAIGAIRIQPSISQSCPNIGTDSLEGVEGRWFVVYSSFIPDPEVSCMYVDVNKVGDDKFYLNSTMDLIHGNSLQIDSFSETLLQYWSTNFKSESSEEGLKHLLQWLKRDGDFLLFSNCLNRDDGGHDEVAWILSRTPEGDENKVNKFSEILRAEGSQVGEFLEFPHEKCRSK
uniref:Venom protein n=1 Tax=Hemiscolopendra marginata TaxID=943146 RepID=A0A646QEW7_9MYRI